MKKYKQEYLDSISSSEIDFSLYDQLYGDVWQEDESERYYGDFKVVGKSKARYAGETYPTDINRLIENLEELKKKGCSHVEIMYHIDHIGYELSGLKFTEI